MEFRECRFPIGKERLNILHVTRRRNQSELVILCRKCLRTHVIGGRKGWEEEDEDLRSYCITFKEKRRFGISRREH